MDDIDTAVARLYAQPPTGFVSARTALAKELKAAGDREAAATVSALRRPTKQAWAIGEAVRRTPQAAAGFFGAIARLAAPGPDLRQRTNDLRGATAALVASVEGLDPGEATAGLLAIAADPDATEATRLGRLAEVPGSGGFGALTVGPEPAGSSSPRADEAAGAAGDGPVVDEGHRSAARRAERDRAEATARDRADRLASLEAERQRASAAERAADRRVGAARVAVDEAQAELVRATSLLAEARSAAAEAGERLRSAEAEAP